MVFCMVKKFVIAIILLCIFVVGCGSDNITGSVVAYESYRTGDNSTTNDAATDVLQEQSVAENKDKAGTLQ